MGDRVLNLKVGDRVYVNPHLTCETCHHCRRGRKDLCPQGCLRGYFAFDKDVTVLNQWPYGGLSQYVLSPDSKVAVLPPSIDLQTAARLGYAGTSYAALRKGAVGPGSTVLINGVTGTLGVAAVAIALGLGATKILGIGRNKERLAKVEELAPAGVKRVFTFQSTSGDDEDEKICAWVKDQTGGLGVTALIDCLGVGGAASSTEAFLRGAVKSGGAVVLVAGGVLGSIGQNYFEFLMRDVTIRGSVWFTDAEADELVALIGAGVVDLSWLDNRAFALDDVNEALAAASDQPGGFVNVVVLPSCPSAE